MNYSRAPILEAIIEFRFKHVLDATTVEAFGPILTAQFGAIERVHGADFEFSINQEGFESSQKQRLDGFKFTMSNQFVGMLIKDRLVISHQAPYTTWDAFDEPIATLWAVAASHFKLNQLTRIGVRTINELVIPYDDPENSEVNLDKYVRIIPRVPNQDAAKMVGFNSQVALTHPSLGASSTVTLSSGRSDKECVRLLLDIDAFMPFDNNLIENISELDNWLKVLRRLKNDLFENAITDRTKELIK